MYQQHHIWLDIMVIWTPWRRRIPQQYVPGMQDGLWKIHTTLIAIMQTALPVLEDRQAQKAMSQLMVLLL